VSGHGTGDDRIYLGACGGNAAVQGGCAVEEICNVTFGLFGEPRRGSFSIDFFIMFMYTIVITIIFMYTITITIMFMFMSVFLHLADGRRRRLQVADDRLRSTFISNCFRFVRGFVRNCDKAIRGDFAGLLKELLEPCTARLGVSAAPGGRPDFFTHFAMGRGAKALQPV